MIINVVSFVCTFVFPHIDPKGDGTGGCSIYGLIDAMQQNVLDVSKSNKRFIKGTSPGARELNKEERKEKGRVAVVEMGG